ncbi:hypothetical protein IF2G_02695 [Cordyceps javanica]|nr:hypothetical protein IF2G_02695 [Cordyceps javanica]
MARHRLTSYPQSRILVITLPRRRYRALLYFLPHPSVILAPPGPSFAGRPRLHFSALFFITPDGKFDQNCPASAALLFCGSLVPCSLSPFRAVGFFLTWGTRPSISHAHRIHHSMTVRAPLHQ